MSSPAATLASPPPVPASAEVPRRAEGSVDRRVVRVVFIGFVAAGAALRIWRAAANGLSYDESFTAMAARLSPGRLFDFLRVADTHPPLDYLVRSPFASIGASDFALRLPSLLFSIGALALFAWWMRSRGTTGLVAVGLFAASPFLVLHGGEARMYALLQLLGVAGACLAEARLRSPQPWHNWAAAGIVGVACLDHVSGILLAAGMFVVVGVGRRRADWIWRAAVAGGVAVWAVLWGPTFVEQAGHDWAGWIPPTSVSAFVDAVGGQVTNFVAVRVLVTVAVGVGGWVIWRRDRPHGRVWLACGALPFVLAAVIGFVSPFLLDRTLTVASWAPALALGALADAAVVRSRRGASSPRSRVTTVAVWTAVALVALGAVSAVAATDEDTDQAIAHLEAVVAPGDVILTRPARYATLADYRIAVQQWGRAVHVAAPGIDDAAGVREAAAASTGRWWLLTPVGSRSSFTGWRSCPGTGSLTDGVTEIRCLQPAPRSAGSS